MIRKHTTVKQLAAIVLSLLMVLSASVPVMADTVEEGAVTTVTESEPPAAEGDPSTETPPTESVAETYTIKIEPNENTDTTVAARFKAYAIFTGNLSEQAVSDGGYNAGTGTQNPPMSNKLANVKWGEGINPESFVNALIGCGDEVEDSSGTKKTVKDLFKDAIANAGYSTGSSGSSGSSVAADSDSIAAAVAKVLAEESKNYPDLVKIFAKLAGENKSEDSVSSNWDGKNWTISVDKPGYYLIVDNYTGKGDEISDYILGVFGNQTVKIKSEGVTFNKFIVIPDQDQTDTETDEDGQEIDLVKVENAGITDKVTFRLIGTLPENFANYNNFKYTFSDTLSSAFTYDENSLNVYAVDETGVVYLVAKNSNTYTFTAPASGTATDIVSFAALNKVTNSALTKVAKIGDTTSSGDVAATVKITNKWKVVVQYTATLDPDAVVVAPGSESTNTNKAKLKYSNNVNKNPENPSDPSNPDSEGETPEYEVCVYTYGIDLNKVDGTNNSKLAGAGFALTREVDDGKGSGTTKKQYAVFTKGTNEYTIVGWVDDPSTLVQDEKWLDPITASATSPVGGYTGGVCYLAIETTDTGTVNIKGLDADSMEYTLSEVVTPSGYDTMEAVSFTISATFDETDSSTLTGVTGTITESGDSAAFINGKTSDTVLTGYVPVELRNMPAGYLPGTGGIGTTLFYVGGGTLLTAAGVLIVVSKKKSKKERNT